MPEIIINDIYIPHLQNQSQIQIFYGGSGSGKSVFLSQRPILDVLAGGRNYLICRKISKTIRKSTFNEIEGVIDGLGLRPYFKTNKTEMSITCENGYQILFAGLDNPLSLQGIRPKQGVITDIWVDEATEIDRKDYKVLDKRLRGESVGNLKKRFTLSFNPILQLHWIYKEWFEQVGWTNDQTKYESEELSILKTWYIHNKFLTQQDIDRLLNEKDEYYKQVYAFGNWGVLGNRIFTNWRVEDLNDQNSEYYLPLEQRTNIRNGGDFGFASDPAAIVRLHYDKMRKRIYIFEELYETGLTNDILADRAKNIVGNERIVWDSADPKSIAELNRYGVEAVGAKKGKDSVVFGIQWLQQNEIIVHKELINMTNELQLAKWKEDAGGLIVRSGGKPVPVDRNNHLIDATRYALEDDADFIGEMQVVENPFYN